jgi:alginate O-acetyltransferase complex protein AlgJ
MTNTRQERTANATKMALIAIFIGLLWLPVLDLFFHWDQTSEVNEKRVLTTFPSLNPGFAGARDFIAGLEAYYNDRFGFRKRLIYWEQNWKRSWFGESPTCNVIIGQRGWLFYNASQSTGDFQEATLFTDKQLQEWRSLLESRRDWLTRRGINYIFVIAPDKQTIYPENLPEGMTVVGSVTKLDQFVAYMKANSSVEVLDLRPALFQAKTSGQTYLYTDSHWNQFGAFTACREIIQKLARQLPGLKPLSMDSFDRKISLEKGGNLAQMLAAKESMLERDYLTLLPRTPLKPLPVSRDYKKWAIVQSTLNSDRKGGAIIFGDSFAEGWFPFLGYHFNKVTLYRLYDIQTPAAHVWKTLLIEQQKPDVVIDEILENLLDQEDAGHIKLVDALK